MRMKFLFAVLLLPSIAGAEEPKTVAKSCNKSMADQFTACDKIDVGAQSPIKKIRWALILACDKVGENKAAQAAAAQSAQAATATTDGGVVQHAQATTKATASKKTTAAAAATAASANEAVKNLDALIVEASKPIE